MAAHLPVDGVMAPWSKRLEARPALELADSCLRGVGQVVFMNNPVTGLLILAGLTVASAWLGLATALGAVAATLTALALGFDRTAVRAGLFGFNGALCGAGLATFFAPQLSADGMVWIVVVAAFSTVITATLARILVPTFGVPGLTLPFNLATLTFLLAAFAFASDELALAADPALPALGQAVDTTLRAEMDGSGASAVGAVLNALLRGVGQVFLADSAIAGLLIVAAMAVCSRIAAGFALVGSLVGLLVALAVGADGFAAYHGLWAYNSVLCAIAVGGVFFVLTWRSALAAVACAAAGALLFAAVGTLLAPLGLPGLTLAFCLATLAFLLIKDDTPRLQPVDLAEVTTPEAHRHAARPPAGAPTGRDPRVGGNSPS
jgi:urea transporter